MELEHEHQHQQHHDQDDVESDSSKKVHQSAATPPPLPSSPPSSPSSPSSSPPLSTSTDQLIMNQLHHQQQHHQDQEQQSQNIVSEKKYNLSDSFEDYLKHLSSFLRFDSPDKWLPSMRSANSSIESLTSLSDSDEKNDLDDNCASSAVSLDINCARAGVVSKLKYDMAELEQNVLNECLSDDDEPNDLMIKMPYPIPSQRLPLILENDSDDIFQSSRHSQLVESDTVPNEKLQNINNFDGDSTRCNNNDNHSISSRNNHSISSRNNRRLTCEEFITHLHSARESCSKSLQIKTHFNEDEDLPNCENESGSYADKKLTADKKLEVEGSAEVQAASKDVTEEIVVDVKLEKNKKKRVKVIEELLATEATYFRHLELIVSLFMQPLMDSHIIPEPAIVEIFGNIRLIMSVNMELSSHMRSESIGQAFLHLAPFLKLYSTYAQNHERALAVLLEWDQKSAEFSKFRRQQEELADMNGLKLNALLITPVQRIPRYKLLLEELLSCTPLDHDDYWPIKNAVVEVQHVASHINEHIRQQDNFMKMLAIQKCFNACNAPRIFAPGRMFIKEGPLRKVSQHGNKSHERMFFLFSDMLMYAKPTALSNTTTTNNNNTNNNCYNNINSNNYHSLVCCCMLPLHHCKVEQVLGGADGQGLLFTVTCKKEHLLLFSDQKTANSWITVLNKQISEIRSSRQTLRKRSSVQQPMRSEGFMKFLRRRNNHNNDADHGDNTFRSTPEKMKQAKKHADKVIRKQQQSRQKQPSILSKLTPSTANHAAAAAARKLNCDSNRWTSTCTQQNLPNKHFSSGLACLKKNKKKMFLEDQEAGKPKVFADLTIVEEHHGIFAGNNNITLNDTIDIISQPNTNYIINVNTNISEFKQDIKSEKDDMKSTVPSSATMQSIHSTTPSKHVGRADVETSHKNINNNCVITPKTPNHISASANKAAFSTRTLNKFISKTIHRRQESGRPPPSPSKLATQTPTALESTATFTKQMPATETRVSAIKKSFIHQRTKSYNDCSSSSSSSSTILSNTDRPKKTSVEMNLPSGQRVAAACDYRDSDAGHEQIDRDQLRLSLKRSQPKKLDAKNFPTTPRSNSVFASKLIRTPSKLFSSPADSISPSPILARSSSKQGNIGQFNCYSPLTNVEASSNSNNIYQPETRGTVEPGEFDNRNNNENTNPRDTVGECDTAINLSPLLRMDCNISRNVTIRKRSKLLRSSTLIERKDLPRVSRDSGCCSDLIGAGELNRHHSAPGQEGGHTDVDGDNYYDGDSDEAEACVLRNLSFKLALSEN